MKCDISKYFGNINHWILSRIIKKKIADKKTLWLIEEILNSSEEKAETGIPIGNLTSQLFANIYLNELDQFVKHKLRVKYYIRYMDDFLILDYNKKELHRIKEEIREFLANELILKLHPKKANVFPVPHHFRSKSGGGGIDFLGYQIYDNYKLLRKSTVKRFIKRTKMHKKKLAKGLMDKEKFSQSLQSWLAYARFGNSWSLRKNLSEKLKVKLIE